MLTEPSFDIIYNIYYLFITFLLYMFQMPTYPNQIFLMQRFETFEDACFYFMKSYLFNLLYFLLPLFFLTIVAFMALGVMFDGVKLVFHFIHLGFIFGFMGFGVLFDVMENKKSKYRYAFAIYICLSFLMDIIFKDIPMINYFIITNFMGLALNVLLMVGIFEKRKQRWFL